MSFSTTCKDGEETREGWLGLELRPRTFHTQAHASVLLIGSNTARSERGGEKVRERDERGRERVRDRWIDR